MNNSIEFPDSPTSAKGSGFSTVLCFLCCGMMGSMLYLVYKSLSVVSDMAIGHCIVYVYVPSLWVAGIAFVLMMLNSVGYLMTRQRVWDFRANAIVEVGMLFATVTLISGFLRARTTRGRWWTEDMVLGTMVLVWGLLLLYLGLRRSVTTDTGRRWLATFGLVACLSVPMAFSLFQHYLAAQPSPVVIRQYAGAESTVLLTLAVGLLAFVLLFWYLVQHRVAVDRMEAELEGLRKIIPGHVWKPQNLLVENQNFVIEEYSLMESQHHE